MARVNLPVLEIIYKDMFAMVPLYRTTRQWLMENEYEDLHGIPIEDAQNMMEVLYWFRKGTAMNPQERELRMWWRTRKRGINVSVAGSVFYRHRLDIDWYVINMVDVEIMREGKKEKAQFAELRILIRPYIEIPDISKTPIIGWFDYWFRSRLMKKNIEENRKMLYQDAYRLHGMLKKYLELKTWQPAEEVLHDKFDFV